MTFKPATFEEAKSRQEATDARRRERAQNRSVSSLRRRTPIGSNGSRKKPTAAKARKRARLPSRAKLIKRLDSLTSQIVRLRDGRCVLCGTTERLQCGHIFGRRSHGARFDIDFGGNTAAQCAPCNQRHNYDQWRFYRWFINEYGQPAFEDLYRRWAKGRKYSNPELRKMIEAYEKKLAEMQA